LLKTYIKGEEWRHVREWLDPDQQRHANEQIGAAVAQIHSIKFSAFGELNDAVAPTGSEAFLPSFRERAVRSIRNPRLLELFLKLVEDRVPLFANIENACLCHEDLHHRNLLFRRNREQWELATVLDFEKAWAGHHEIDLARLEFWDGMVGDGFCAAYHTIHQVDPLYKQRRPIYQLLWCFEYAAATSRHLADTQRLCLQLGLPPIISFDD
jgi:aminoglycoside phosphotransferase (APT) family kinase protein